MAIKGKREGERKGRGSGPRRRPPISHDVRHPIILPLRSNLRSNAIYAFESPPSSRLSKSRASIDQISCMLCRSNDGVDGVEGDAHAGGRFECGFQKTLAHRGYACGTGGTCGNASSAVRQIRRRSQLYDLARSRPGGNSSIFASEAATYHFADQRQDRIFPRRGASLYLHAFATWIRRLRG